MKGWSLVNLALTKKESVMHIPSKGFSIIEYKAVLKISFRTAHAFIGKITFLFYLIFLFGFYHLDYSSYHTDSNYYIKNDVYHMNSPPFFAIIYNMPKKVNK